MTSVISSFRKESEFFIMWLAVLVVLVLILLYRWYRQSQILENLSDKYVFITGCDSGFGNMLAKQLDKRGMRVLAACLTDTGAETLKKETSSRLQTLKLDITDSKSVSSAANWVSITVGNAGLWGVVNNAGFGFALAPNEWQKVEDFSKVLNINLLGMINVTLNLLHLVRKARGRIVNVSSGAGRLSIFGGGYCISKYGVEAFSDSLRREMRDFGVKVSIIEPGTFQTLMANSMDGHGNNLRRLWENLPTALKDSYGQRYYDQYMKVLQNLVRSASPRAHMVSDCMEHAVTAIYPWTRYSPGWDCKLYLLPISYLPTVISDYLLCRSAPKPACM
ncbi:retinol dehydrogenase 7-like isoform X4 [Pseudophryne corroboree]|uniref:retinol dehydrogenase 7-like isoform X2 n=1 Tax=Pseudophryne corroboree TaxID=495146 RepID=UPI0030819D1B